MSATPSDGGTFLSTVSGTLFGKNLLPKGILLLLYAAQGCGLASLAEGTVVPLMQCPLSVMAGIWNLIIVPAIAHILLAKDTVGSLLSTN